MKSPSKLVSIVASITCISVVLLLCGTTENSVEVAEIIDSQDRVTYYNDILSVDSSTHINNLLESADSGNKITDPGTIEKSNATYSDLRPLAKELSNYVGANGHGYTSWDGYFNSHTGCTGYDSSIADEITITFNNTTHTAKARVQYYGLRSDCSGGVSAMLFFMGVTGSGNKIDNLRAEDYQKAGSSISASTFGDLNVGDILAIKSHVAMVAFKDSSKVYMFDWGTTKAIDKCKEQGYYNTYPVGAAISTWRTTTVHARRLL